MTGARIERRALAGPSAGLISICVVAAILAAEGCDGGKAASPPGPKSAWSAPSIPLGVPLRRLRRLSNREYDNVVHDLLGDDSHPATGFVVDVYPNGYDNGSANLAVQSDQVVQYETAAEALAASAVAGQLPRLLGGCDVTTQGQGACLEAMLASFAARAFRRPLLSTEAQRLRAVFQEELTTEGFSRALQTVVEVVLQSPQFLYREELGASDASGQSGATVRITDYEAASELSFLLTGSIPDDELWSAASAGRFTNADDYAREAARLLTTPRARSALRAFLHQWLATDGLDELAKDPTLYPTFSRALAESMTSELDWLFDDVLWSGSGTLRELFSSPRAFVDAPLSALYGAAPGAGAVAPRLSPTRPSALVSSPSLAGGPWLAPAAVAAAGWRSVSLDATLRPGVLTRAGFLSAHSDSDSSGPIARGVFLLQQIMCMPPPPPPPDVPRPPAATDPSVQGLTTRDRFADHVSSARCAGCHDQIDGIGFGFEEFDGLGAFRQEENGQPVLSTGAVVGTGEIDGPFDGAGEFIARLSGSRLLADCYARQAYRYAMGAVEPSGADLGWLTAATSADAKMVGAFLSIVRNPVFSTRAFE